MPFSLLNLFAERLVLLTLFVLLLFYFKIIKIARTIADLENSSAVKTNHIAEALAFRNMQKKYEKLMH